MKWREIICGRKRNKKKKERETPLERNDKFTTTTKNVIEKCVSDLGKIKLETLTTWFMSRSIILIKKSRKIVECKIIDDSFAPFFFKRKKNYLFLIFIINVIGDIELC